MRKIKYKRTLPNGSVHYTLKGSRKGKATLVTELELKVCALPMLALFGVETLGFRTGLYRACPKLALTFALLCSPAPPQEELPIELEQIMAIEERFKQRLAKEWVSSADHACLPQI